MKREEVLQRLNDQAEALKAMGATSLYLFGSTARDEASDSSDLDLFIEYDRERKFSLLDLVGMKHFLEDEIGMPVDLGTRDSLHPVLRDRIEKSAVRIF